jgi:hypothetical protein
VGKAGLALADNFRTRLEDAHQFADPLSVPRPGSADHLLHAVSRSCRPHGLAKQGHSPPLTKSIGETIANMACCVDNIEIEIERIALSVGRGRLSAKQRLGPRRLPIE